MSSNRAGGPALRVGVGPRPQPINADRLPVDSWLWGLDPSPGHCNADRDHMGFVLLSSFGGDFDQLFAAIGGVPCPLYEARIQQPLHHVVHRRRRDAFVVGELGHRAVSTEYEHRERGKARASDRLTIVDAAQSPHQVSNRTVQAFGELGRTCTTTTISALCHHDLVDTPLAMLND